MSLQDIKLPNLESLIAVYERVLEKPTFIDTNIFLPPILAKGNPYISMVNILNDIQQHVNIYKNSLNIFIDYFKKYGELLFDLILKNFDKILITQGIYKELTETNLKLCKHNKFIRDRERDWESKLNKNVPPILIKVIDLLKNFEEYYINELNNFLMGYKKRNKILDREILQDSWYQKYPEILNLVKVRKEYKMVRVKPSFIRNLLDHSKESELVKLIKEELDNNPNTIILPYIFYINFIKHIVPKINWREEIITGKPFYIRHDKFTGSRFYELYNFNDEELVAIALCFAASRKEPFKILTRDIRLAENLKQSYPIFEDIYKKVISPQLSIDLSVHSIIFYGTTSPQEIIFSTK